MSQIFQNISKKKPILSESLLENFYSFGLVKTKKKVFCIIGIYQISKNMHILLGILKLQKQHFLSVKECVKSTILLIKTAKIWP